jgi:vacuolar-type H+-ATPase subunit C/Vma6
MMFLNKRTFLVLGKMSYLSPISALPVVHYLALMRQEVRDIRMIARGLSVGLEKDLIEAHIGA